MTNTALRIEKIEDREGFGVCSHCGREGLRWIATLSDGSGCGLECAKRVVGFKPAPTAYRWAEHFEAVAEYRETNGYGDVLGVWVLWQHKSGTATRETLNGNLQTVGGCRVAWERRGWL